MRVVWHADDFTARFRLRRNIGKAHNLKYGAALCVQVSPYEIQSTEIGNRKGSLRCAIKGAKMINNALATARHQPSNLDASLLYELIFNLYNVAVHHAYTG
jgi:hypothetical protein